MNIPEDLLAPAVARIKQLFLANKLSRWVDEHTKEQCLIEADSGAIQYELSVRADPLTEDELAVADVVLQAVRLRLPRFFRLEPRSWELVRDGVAKEARHLHRFLKDQANLEITS